jgi:hypothetical protein
MLFHNEFHIDAGEAYGSQLLGDSADTLTDQSTSLWDGIKAVISGLGGALWTPCTSDATLQTLVTGAFNLATAPVAVTELAAEAVAAEGVAETVAQKTAFWSGSEAARQAAREWAAANGASTVEMADTATRAEIDAASRIAAERATGEVPVFQSSTRIDLGSTWARIEYPALVQNQNVTEIVFHLVP